MGAFDVSAAAGEVGFTWVSGDELFGVRMSPEEALQLGKALLIKADAAERQRKAMTDDSGPIIIMPGVARMSTRGGK